MLNNKNVSCGLSRLVVIINLAPNNLSEYLSLLVFSLKTNYFGLHCSTQSQIEDLRMQCINNERPKAKLSCFSFSSNLSMSYFRLISFFSCFHVAFNTLFMLKHSSRG